MEILEASELKQESARTTKALPEHYGMNQSLETWHHKNLPLYIYVVFNLGLAVVLPSWTLSIKHDRFPLQIPFQISLANPLLNKKAAKLLIQKHK